MRRMTKCVAAMLVLTCAMTMVPQKAEASLYGIITAIVDGSEYIPLEPEPPGPVALTIVNSATRDIELTIESSDGDREVAYIGPHSHYWRYAGIHGDVGLVYGDSEWYAVTLRVIKWVDGKPKVVSQPKDFQVFAAGAIITVYKQGRGDWRLYGRYLR